MYYFFYNMFQIVIFGNYLINFKNIQNGNKTNYTSQYRR